MAAAAAAQLCLDARVPVPARMGCVWSTGDRASRHAHGTAVLIGQLAVPGPCLGCTVVSSAVFLCFAFVDIRSFLEPLIFLEIAPEVVFSIETQVFLLKRRQNAF